MNSYELRWTIKDKLGKKDENTERQKTKDKIKDSEGLQGHKDIKTKRQKAKRRKDWEGKKTKKKRQYTELRRLPDEFPWIKMNCDEPLKNK